MNFTGQPFTGFHNYTPQNPVDAMVMVGMQKQQELQAGIQKVQGFVDTLHGFDLAKDVTKEYLQGKINDLHQSINNISGNFSDQRLVSQIGGLAGKIAGDPIIENGIISTAAYRKGIRDIEDSKKLDKDGKGGTYAIQNEWDFMSGASKWLNDNDFTTSFSGTYTPHTDYMKRFTDAYKEIHPSSTLTEEQVRVNDGTGQLEVLNQKEKEGIDANEVSRLWSTISSDPAVQKQISIDARYRYKDLDAKDMYDHLSEDYSQNIDNINNKIKDIQERAAVDKTISPTAVASAIQALRDQGSQYAEQYKGIVSLIPGTEGGGGKDLDAAKTAIFATDLQSNLASTYAWSKSTDKVVDSPLWKAHMDQIKYELDLSKFGEEIRHNKATEEISLLNALKEGKSAKTPGEGTLPTGEHIITTEDQVDKAAGEKTSATYYQTTKDLEGQLDQAMRSSIFNIANSQGLDNPFRRTAAGLEYNPDYPGGLQAARAAGAKLWTTSRQAIISGKAKDFVVSEFNKVDPLIREVNSRREQAKQTETKYEPQLQKVADQYGKPIDRGMLDYWIVENNAPGKEAAQKRLDALSPKDREALDSRIVLRTQMGLVDYKTKDYNDLSAFLKKNSNIVPTLSSREEDFKRMQTAFNPTVTLIETPKNEEKESWRQKFVRLAQKYNLNDNNEDFLKELGAGKAKEKVATEGNVYSTVFDKNANKWYIRISRAGGADRQVEVTERDIQDLGFQTSDPFWDKFGHDLQLTQNTKTDVHNRGIASAYILQQPRGSKYQVKYHLYGDGAGQYGLRLYVQDQTGKMLAENVNLGAMFNKDAIMTLVQNGLKDEEVEGILTKNR